MTDPGDERAAVRLRLRDVRRNVSRHDAILAAERLAGRLEDLDELRGPGRLGTYLPVDGEIDPNRGIDRLRERGWQVYLPVIEDPPPRGGAPSMRFAPWSGDAPMRPNRYGILEPAASPTITALQLDVIVVPCVAIDRDGQRLGFGAGYYDRALEAGAGPAPWDQRSRTVTVAAAYGFQVMDEVAAEAWDVPMDLVLTDEAVIRPLR